jgi:hypothetical protein
LVRQYVESQEGAIHLEFLPPYAPELNPVEYLWAHWKHQLLSQGLRRTDCPCTRQAPANTTPQEAHRSILEAS